MENGNKLLKLKNARIFARNFSGITSPMNKDGMRTFCVELPDNLVEPLAQDGWNVKYRNKGEHEAYLPVTVSYRFTAPNIIQRGNNGLIQITEDTVGNIDHCDICNVDLIINPSKWEKLGNHGIKAYLRAMQYELVDDDFGDNSYGEHRSWENDISDDELPFN